ncbi:hypothetical protein P692DRAFT_20753620, partial [Suillus brevipes Sb2]
MAKFPRAHNYLGEIYDCRERWAWAWVSHIFTAGIRTNGRVEVENRINKVFGGPKKTLLQLFNSLNERTDGQTVQEMVRNLETLFAGPLALLRKHAGPFALQKCYKEMEQSLFYDTEVVQRPLVNQNSQFPLQHMMNNFKNDEAYISTKWLLRLINSRGLEIQHLLKIVNRGTKTTHFLAILQNDSYLCDCCMGMNLGIPCRHYFQALTRMPALSFHIGLV